MATPLNELLNLIEANIKVNSAVVSPYKTTGHMLKEVMLALANYGGAGVPVGSIIAWGKEEVPSGWLLCDGTNGTEDLRGRTIVGHKPGDTYFGTLGFKGGDTHTTLTVANLPKFTPTGRTSTDPGHTHNFTLDQRRSGNDAGKHDNWRPGGNMPRTSSSAGSHSHDVTMDPIGGDQPFMSLDPYIVNNWIQYIGFGEAPEGLGGTEDIVLNTYDDYSGFERVITIEEGSFTLKVTNGNNILPQIIAVGEKLTLSSPLIVPEVADVVQIEITVTTAFGSLTEIINVVRNIPEFSEPTIKFTNLDIIPGHPSLSTIPYPSGSITREFQHTKCVLKPDNPVIQSLGYTWTLKSITSKGKPVNGINAKVDPANLNITLDTEMIVPGSHGRPNEGLSFRNNQIYNIKVEGKSVASPTTFDLDLEVKIHLPAYYSIHGNSFMYTADNLKSSYVYMGDYVLDGNNRGIDISKVSNGDIIDFRVMITPFTLVNPIDTEYVYSVMDVIPLGEENGGSLADQLPAGSSLDPNTGNLRIVANNSGSYWIRSVSVGLEVNVVRYSLVSINTKKSLFYGNQVIKSNSTNATLLTPTSLGNQYAVELIPKVNNFVPGEYDWTVTLTRNRTASEVGMDIGSEIRITDLRIELDTQNFSTSPRISSLNNGVYKVKVKGVKKGSNPPDVYLPPIDQGGGFNDFLYPADYGYNASGQTGVGPAYRYDPDGNLKSESGWDPNLPGGEIPNIDDGAFLPEEEDVVEDEFEVVVALTKGAPANYDSSGAYFNQYDTGDTCLIKKYGTYEIYAIDVSVGAKYRLDFLNYAEGSDTDTNTLEMRPYDFVKGVPSPINEPMYAATPDQSNLVINNFNGLVELQGPMSASNYWISFKKLVGGVEKTMYTCIRTF